MSFYLLRPWLPNSGWNTPARSITSQRGAMPDSRSFSTPEPNRSPCMRRLNSRYTHRFNWRHHRVGHVLQGRFKSLVMEQERYLLELCRYPVLNPVRAGLVATPPQ